MELEETSYWLELLEEGRVCSDPEVSALRKEAGEPSAILVTLIRKVRQGIDRQASSEF
jgi:four helix bundle protein